MLNLDIDQGCLKIESFRRVAILGSRLHDFMTVDEPAAIFNPVVQHIRYVLRKHGFFRAVCDLS
jgi:hypothetical protein